MIKEVTGSKSHVDVQFIGQFMESRGLSNRSDVLHVPYNTVDDRRGVRGIIEIPPGPPMVQIDSYVLRESGK